MDTGLLAGLFNDPSGHTCEEVAAAWTIAIEVVREPYLYDQAIVEAACCLLKHLDRDEMRMPGVAG